MITDLHRILLGFFLLLPLAACADAPVDSCLQVTLTGTQGGPPATNGLAGSGTLVQYGSVANECSDVLLQFDVGRGTTERLSQLGISVNQIDAAFLTHIHSDHSEGLAGLLQLRWHFLGGEMDQWYPALFENQNVVKNLATPEEGYNLQVDQTDKAINWMRGQNSIAPDRPFFLYYATGATHAPHHVPQEWVKKYKGKFAHGFDKQREITFKRQTEMGVIPQDAKLTPRPEELRAWASLSPDERRVSARLMEVYAGFLAHTDEQVGRVFEALRDLEEFDDTLVLYVVGDNGGSGEGGGKTQRAADLH